MPFADWESVGRDDPFYKACTAVTTATGAILGGATGSVLGPGGTVGGYLGGAAWGLAAGYLACPHLVPAVKQKIENGTSLTTAEVSSAAEPMGRYANVSRASDAVKLVALVRQVSGGPREATACGDPQLAERQVLQSLG